MESLESAIEKYSTNLLDNVFEELKGDELALVNLLDYVISYEGLVAEKSNWYSPNFKEDTLKGIKPDGKLVIENGNTHFYKLRIKDPILKTTTNMNDGKNRIKLLKIFGLYDEISNKVKDIEEYFNNHSISLVYRIVFYKGDSNPYITIGVVLDKFALGIDETILVTHTFEVSRALFDNALKEILERKITYDQFLNDSHQSPLSSIENEGSFWFTDNGRLVSTILLKEEVDFFIEKILPTLKHIDWESLKYIFDEFEKFYSPQMEKDTYISSAPDTSKFKALKSGKFEFAKDFRAGESQYSRGRYFKYGLQIGSNYSYGSPWNLMKYILMYIKNSDFGLPKYSDGQGICISTTNGTSWSAIGIG